MALLKVYTFPEEVLRTPAEPVTEFDSKLEKLTADMLETMYDAPGVGLAANQVGILKRIVVIDADYDIEGEEDNLRRYVNQNPRIVINPEILEKSGSILFKEGCLSVPGFAEEVKRFEKVKLKYQDLKGETHVLDAEGTLAVVIQHELDHLDGKLFIDRLSMIKKQKIKGKLKKDRGEKFDRSRFHVEL